MNINFRLCLCLLLCSFFSCKNDLDVSNDFVVKLRLADEPDRINPMLSKSSYATQVEAFIFLPLMEFDPADLVMKPILASAEPIEEEIKEGKYKGGTSFKYTIRKEATWTDGQPVTAEDYLFTVKAAINPHTQANTWRSFLSTIDSIIIDNSNPKKFEVIVGQSYMLAKTSTANFNIYPKHFYDPKGLMDNYNLSQLKKDSVGGRALNFANNFAGSEYSRKRIMGSGPYKLTMWDAQKNMILERKANWWGSKINSSTIFKANPFQMIYMFIPDETTALTLLKDGQLDIMSSMNPTAYADLKKNAHINQLQFFTPAIMQYYYLALNNLNPLLDDKRVRLALSHTLDLNSMSDVLMAGLAEPISGPIHPSKSYHNDNLEPIPFDLDMAKSLLKESGWEDSNENDIVDKVIEGQLQELSLTIYVTQKELGKNIARILKENASKIGVEINIESKEWGFIRKKLGTKDFDIVAMATRQSPDISDLYQSWHTKSIGPGGRNMVGFGNAKSDAIIEELRHTKDIERRNNLFMEIQKIIHDEQPMIFLFAPTETIAVSSKIDLITSSKRPGYFENTASLN